MPDFANILKLLVSGLRLNTLRRNQYVAALAVVGLYLQLAAGAFCTAGLPSDRNLSLFPICHSSIDDTSSASKTGHGPQQHSCPFCAIHCHAAVALTPVLHFAVPAVLTAMLVTRQTASQPHLRFAIAAQPRGPPYLS